MPSIFGIKKLHYLLDKKYSDRTPKGLLVYKHKARLTQRRREILILIAKGYNNDEISKAMGLSIMNTKLQKWRLYCYLGDIHNVIDAVYMGIQKGLLEMKDISEGIKEKIYERINKKQKYGCIQTK